MNALEDRGLDAYARLIIVTSGVGGTIYTQSKDDMSQLGVGTTVITKTTKTLREIAQENGRSPRWSDHQDRRLRGVRGVVGAVGA